MAEQSFVSDLSGAITDINHNLNRLGEYSNESNLALNATKTKWMLVSTPQMSRYHSLDKKEIVMFSHNIDAVALKLLTGVLFASVMLFLQWGSKAFKNMTIVPPGSGIVHQVCITEDKIGTCILWIRSLFI